MIDLKMNIYAFSKPTTRQECIELLREMNRMADELHAQWDGVEEALKQHAELAIPA